MATVRSLALSNLPWMWQQVQWFSGAHVPLEPCCHGVVYDDRSLHQSDRTSSPSTHLQVLPTPHQFTFQPERLGRVPHAGPPTYQDHED